MDQTSEPFSLPEPVHGNIDTRPHLARLRANVEGLGRRLISIREDVASQAPYRFSSTIARFLARRLAWFFTRLREYLSALDGYLAACEASTTNSLALLRQQAESQERRLAILDARLGELIAGVALDAAKLKDVLTGFQNLTSDLAVLRSRLDATEAVCARLLDDFAASECRQRDALIQLEEDVSHRSQALETALEQMRGSAGALERRLGNLEASVRNHFSPLALPPGLSHLYRQFQDAFRGSSEEIKNRFAVYLPELFEALSGCDSRLVLDLACGRGEWLELLRENGVAARGVDANAAMVEICRARGLTVDHGDAIEFLESQPEGVWGAITVFHLVEHLTFERRIRLLDLSFRVLATGGMLVLETPNPENLLVGAHNFYMDPTHERPIPPQSLEFFVRSRGFAPVRIERLHPYPQSYCLPPETGQAGKKLNELLFGPQDYAVIGRKP